MTRFGPHTCPGLSKMFSRLNDSVAQEVLKNIIREGMRLHPVVSTSGVRTTGKDFYLKDKAMVIPKGSHVLFPSIILTRNDIDDSEEFKPSRWQSHPDKSCLLFSAGRRNCVGQSLALAEVTWVLSRLCASYTFEVESEGMEEYSVVNKCVGAKLKARRIRREMMQ